MATLRNETNKTFTILNNYILHRTDVSLKAIGMYAKMVSLPDNWSFTEAGLCTICKDGKDSVRNSLKELEDIGLLFRFQVKERGKFGNCIYYISSEPMTEDEKREILGRYKPMNALVVEKIDELPLSENPISENPISEKQAQLNTNILNTNILNTKEYNNTLVKDEEKVKLNEQIAQIVEIFNTKCTNLPKVIKITDKRKTAIKKLLKEITIEQFKEVCEKANTNDFLIGKGKNGWKADFDFIIKSDKAISILEGKYTSNTPTKTNNFNQYEQRNYADYSNIYANNLKGE